MPSIAAPSVPLSQVGRAAHDLGVAGLLGGNLFGRLALHPSVTEISDEAERGKVVNAAWRRYGTINTLGLAAVSSAGSARAATRPPTGGSRPRSARSRGPRTRWSASSRSAGVRVRGAGRAVRRKAPGGAVPLADGDHAAPERERRRPSREAASQRAGRRVAARRGRPRRRQRGAGPACVPPPARPSPRAPPGARVTRVARSPCCTCPPPESEHRWDSTSTTSRPRSSPRRPGPWRGCSPR